LQILNPTSDVVRAFHIGCVQFYAGCRSERSFCSGLRSVISSRSAQSPIYPLVLKPWSMLSSFLTHAHFNAHLNFCCRQCKQCLIAFSIGKLASRSKICRLTTCSGLVRTLKTINENAYFYITIIQTLQNLPLMCYLARFDMRVPVHILRSLFITHTLKSDLIYLKLNLYTKHKKNNRQWNVTLAVNKN